MVRIRVTRTIEAPVDVVFNLVADAGQFSKALPHVLNVEFLTEAHKGLGTRFRETRLMNGREETTELQVTEYVENDRVRMVADSHGTVWDTVFTVAANGGTTTLTMTMDAESHKLLSKLMNPLFKGMIAKAVGKDMDLVKAYCEGKPR